MAGNASNTMRITRKLMNLPVITTSFETIAIDMVGPHCQWLRGKYRFILTIMDMMTRDPEVIPPRSVDPVSVLEALLIF